MKWPSLWPKQVKAFRDNYLAAMILVAAIFFTLPAFSQVDTNRVLQRITAYGYSWKSGAFDSAFYAPADTFKLSAQFINRAIAAKGGKLWLWSTKDGTNQWVDVTGGLSGDTLFIQNGPTSTFLKTIARVGVNGDTLFIKSLAVKGTGVTTTDAGDSLTFSIPDASAASPGLLTTNYQTVAGRKEFVDGVNSFEDLRMTGENSAIIIKSPSNTASRPSLLSTDRAIRWNNDSTRFEVFDGSIWRGLAYNGEAGSVGRGSSVLPSFYDGLDTAQIRWVNNRNLFWEFPNAANTKQTYIGADSSNLNLVPNDTMNIGITSKSSVVRFRNMSPSGDSVLYLDANRILRNKLLAISTLSDVDITTTPPSSGEFLKYNGTKWVNQAPSTIYPIRIGDSIKLTNGVDTTSGAFVRSTITLSGDVTGSGNSTITATLANSGVSAGTYGSATQVPQLTVDAKGRVTGVTNVTISGGVGGTPGGSDTHVQFNDGGSFGGDAGLTYNKTSNTLTTDSVYASNIRIGGIPTVSGWVGLHIRGNSTQSTDFAIRATDNAGGLLFAVTNAGVPSFPGIWSSVSSTNLTPIGRTMTWSINNLGSTTGTLHTFTAGSTTTANAGTINLMRLLGNYAPTSSSSANYNGLAIEHTINYTGSAIARGLYINPTLTSAPDYRAIEVASGRSRLRSVELTTAGDKLSIATGSNASIGTATLVAGTVTVNTTAVTASSRIFVTVSSPGGTQGFLSIGTITAGTSFVINSTSATETSVVNWWIIN